MICSLKDEKSPDALFHRTLLTSILGIVLCTVCLAGSTWAWFTTESISVEGNVLVAANFSGTVTVAAAEGTIAVNHDKGCQMADLAAGIPYEVTLVAAGEAAGYARVTLGEAHHYTPPLQKGDTLHFNVIPDGNVTMKVCFIWGSFSGEADISEGITLSSDTEN